MYEGFVTWMYFVSMIVGMAAMSTGHVTEAITTIVMNTSVVAAADKEIAEGRSKSNVLISDETCRIGISVNKIWEVRMRNSPKRSRDISRQMFSYLGKYPANWSGVEEEHRRFEHRIIDTRKESFRSF